MSLPKELLDQLLTGYLDDALTSDERIRVEQLLRSNAEIADELEQLRDLRRSLQVLSRADSDVTLDQGFADRVLGAAVARAREEGLGDDHPLIRLAEQPSTSPATVVPKTNTWRTAALMVGLAASIVIAVFLLRPQGNPDPNMIAQSGAQNTRTAPDQQTAPDQTVIPDETETAINSEPGPMLVEDGGTALDDVASIEPTPTVDRTNEVPVLTPGSDPVIDPAASTQESIAVADVSPPTRDEESDVTKVPDAMTQLGAILVMEVRRTDAGRASDAVAKAMSAAEIAPASRKEVTDEIAGFVAGKIEDASDDASVLYLQLPGKQFDLFYQQLWADEVGIESVRMTIAMKAPFMQVVDSVRPDPTTIQHEAAAYELFSQNGVVDQLVQQLSQLPFPAADRRRASTNLLGSGPDIQAQVLVLVR